MPWPAPCVVGTMNALRCLILGFLLVGCGSAPGQSSASANASSAAPGSCADLNLFADTTHASSYESLDGAQHITFALTTASGCRVLGGASAPGLQISYVTDIIGSQFTFQRPSSQPSQCSYQVWAKGGTWNGIGVESSSVGRTHYLNFTCADGYGFSGFSTDATMSN
jgi:hypothetical protein